MGIIRSNNGILDGSNNVIRNQRGWFVSENIPIPPTSSTLVCQSAVGGSYSQIIENSVSIVIDLSPASFGRIFEGGANVRGQMLYCFGGNLIYECGQGGNGATGPAGLNKPLRGWTTWPIPAGTNQYIVEVISRSQNSGGDPNSGRAYLRVDGFTVSSDIDTWSNTLLAGGNASHGCGTGNANMRANQFDTNGGGNAGFTLTNANLVSLDFWRDFYIEPPF